MTSVSYAASLPKVPSYTATAERKGKPDFPGMKGEAPFGGTQISGAVAAGRRADNANARLKLVGLTDKQKASLDLHPHLAGAHKGERLDKVWYDFTKAAQWPAHEKKYTLEFGQGTPLFYGDE